MPSKTARPEHYLALDSLRGIAATVVVVHHFVISVPIRQAFVDRGPADNVFFHNGGMLVDFFFVLSGLVIALTYARPGRSQFSFRDFAIRRFARIYPLHLVMLLVMLGFKIAKLGLVAFAHMDLPDSGANNLYTFVANVFLLHALGFTQNLSWNGPSWSISAEFYTYFLFGFILLALQLLKERIPLSVVAAFTSALSLFIIIEVLGFTNLEFHVEFGVLRCVYSFFIGVLAFKAISYWTPSISPRLGGALQWLGLALSLVTLFLIGAYPPLSMAAPFAFALLLGALMAQPGRPLARLLSTRPLVWLGERSYSIYMTHAAVLIVFEVAVRKLAGARFQTGSEIASGAVSTTILLAMLACVFVLSNFTYRHIEKSGSTLVRRWLTPGASSKTAQTRISLEEQRAGS